MWLFVYVYGSEFVSRRSVSPLQRYGSVPVTAFGTIGDDGLVGHRWCREFDRSHISQGTKLCYADSHNQTNPDLSSRTAIVSTDLFK